MRRYFIAFVFLGAICGERAAAQTLVKTAFKFSFGLVRCVAEGIKANKLELVKLSDDAGKRPFNPAQPDAWDKWTLPASPFVKLEKPVGS